MTSRSWQGTSSKEGVCSSVCPAGLGDDGTRLCPCVRVHTPSPNVWRVCRRRVTARGRGRHGARALLACFHGLPKPGRRDGAVPAASIPAHPSRTAGASWKAVPAQNHTVPCHPQCQCFAGTLGMPQAPMPMKTPGCKARLCQQSSPGRFCRMSRCCSGTACGSAEISWGRLGGPG